MVNFSRLLVGISLLVIIVHLPIQQKDVGIHHSVIEPMSATLACSPFMHSCVLSASASAETKISYLKTSSSRCHRMRETKVYRFQQNKANFFFKCWQNTVAKLGNENFFFSSLDKISRSTMLKKRGLFLLMLPHKLLLY